MAKKKSKSRVSPTANRIPLDFDTAVSGLLGVDPQKLSKPVKKAKAKKKPVKKK